ncbi:MAG: hypothetical protein GEV03_24790 [Streptosporangiales bacterium]|nr:hypothetical protein [Streptosporangiales bacterium]
MTEERGQLYKMRDKHPRFETLDTDYGVLIGARRNAEEDSYYWRITQFLMPFHTIIPPYGKDPVFSGHAWVPMDDESTMALCFSYHPTRRLAERELSMLREGRKGEEGLHPTVNAFVAPRLVPGDDDWRMRLNMGNDYEVDWMAQRVTRFSGLPGIWPQDGAMQEGMGAIYDRTQEHLGASDTGIIRMRRRLIRAAKALRDEGIAPRGVTAAEEYRVRSAALVLPRETPWVAGSAPFRAITPGVNYDAA